METRTLPVYVDGTAARPNKEGGLDVTIKLLYRPDRTEPVQTLGWLASLATRGVVMVTFVPSQQGLDFVTSDAAFEDEGEDDEGVELRPEDLPAFDVAAEK